MRVLVPTALLAFAATARCASVLSPGSLVASSSADVSALHIDDDGIDKIATKVATVLAEQQHQHNVASLEDIHPVDYSCVSRAVYYSILNTVSSASENLSEAATSQDKTYAIVFLVVFLIVGLAMLLLGEHFLKSALGFMTGYVSFMMLLYFFDWVITPALLGPGENTFVNCGLPLLLAVLGSIIVTSLVLYLVDSVEWLMIFIFGAALGAIGMLALRSALLAGNPSLGHNNSFNWYWAGLVAVSLLCGLVAAYLRKVVVITSTVVVGSYMFGTGSLGLIALYNNSPMNGGWFFAFFIPACIVGAYVQIRAYPKDKK